MSTSTGVPVGNAAPVSQSERISIIDSLRGIALCGILLMNIPGFAFPNNVSYDPSVYHESGINFKAYYFIDWFLEGSQRAIFSMLFGAGMLIFLERLEKRTTGMMAAELFMRRQLWLLLFGLVNAFLFLWFWDILYHYAICGIIVFAFRRLLPKYLIIGALVCLILSLVRDNRDLYKTKNMISKGETIAAIDTTHTKLTDEQKEQLGKMTGFKEEQQPESKLKKAEKEKKKMLGNFSSEYELRSESSVQGETTFFYYYGIWDILLCMFLGMAFFKLGILQGEAPARVYVWMAILGLGIGLGISYLRLQPSIVYQFNEFHRMKNISFSFYELSRIIRAMGIFGVIMLLYKSGWFKWFFALIRPVGQMAFSNYLMQSIICAIIFNGIGFALFGKLERYQIYFVVISVWIFQIIFSHIWLSYFRFGPFEWLWRSLTYWKRQPFLKASVKSTELATH